MSIIIPTFGKSELTLKCLSSILTNRPNCDFEVIVVDDGSTDKTEEVLGLVRGIVNLRNPENEGFISSCNAGAKIAQGTYLHFLNNDVAVTAGWLGSLVGTFQDFPNAGLVGSKLLYPNGVLQEAGGLVRDDAGVRIIGRFEDANHPDYSFARIVDYVSGAALLIKKSLFDQLGGFDPLYAPGYYEDTDLAQKVQELGLLVLVQAESVVYHAEGGTSGTDIQSGMKAFQPINALKFQNRWVEFLKKRKFKFLEKGIAGPISGRPKLLFIDAITPEPDKDAGSLESVNLMLLFSQMGFEVTFVPEANFSRVKNYTRYLASRGVRPIYAPYFSTVKKFLTHDRQVFDVVVLVRPLVAKNCFALVRTRFPRAKVIYVAADLHSLRMKREAELKAPNSTTHEQDKIQTIEYQAMSEADAVIVHSLFELDVLKTEFPDRTVIAKPLSLNSASELVPLDNREGLLFLGGFLHSPNVDAVEYFIREIFPIILEKRPNEILSVVGSNPTKNLLSLQSKNVKILGHTSNLTQTLNSAQILVAPLRFGAGFKGKIATAIANGLPVITTSVGIEGMGLVRNQELLVADDPASFAEQVLNLLEDPSRWRALQKSGHQKAIESWGPRAGWTSLSSLLTSLEVDHISEAPEVIQLHDLDKSFKN